MFRIEQVKLSNFRSFEGLHTWGLPVSSGLYFLTGYNKDNPKLDRNGAGKTTLLDAITWGLFGRATSGLRAADIVARDSSGICSVCITGNLRNAPFEVIRTQSPNSLTFNGEAVDQEELNKKIGLNYDAFCYSVIFPQSGKMFFDLSPTEKLNLFSSIMGLDKWLEYSDKASEEAVEIESKIITTNVTLAVVRDRVRTGTQSIQELTTKSDNWRGKQDQKLTTLTDQHLLKIRELKGLSDQLEPYKAEIDVAERGIKEVDDTLASIRGELASYEKAWTELDKEQAVLRSTLRIVEVEQEKLANVGPCCPMCKQLIPTGWVDSQIGLLGGLTERTRIREVVAEKEALEDLVTSLENRRDELKIDWRELQQEGVKIKGNFNALSRSKLETEADVRYILREVKQVTEAKNEFAELLGSKQVELARSKTEIVALQDTVDTLTAYFEATKFWIQGFKKLRLYIIEETLRTLEVEVNNNLTALGMSDYTIEFDIERENKSGSTTRGFTVNVSRVGGVIHRLETFSGGESQLLKLAGTLGLANLIFERVGLVNTLEVFDEPSSHLSKEAVLSLTELLQHRAMTTDRCIILVDHQAIEFGGFLDTITVVKDESGSHLE